jgi:hypothetical protein
MYQDPMWQDYLYIALMVLFLALAVTVTFATL